ncbi:MAG: hypothetical protein R3B95_11575 [Nitrospirales bacterium]|nr:hypothetical protein [Nitrospirales bacterium]
MERYLKPIADGGSDGASGATLANAWGTLPYALGAMAQDDTLFVSGTHITSNSSFDNIKSGSGGGTYTHIRAYEPGVSKFLGGTLNHRVVIYPDNKSWIALHGFALDGNSRLSSYGITGSTTHSSSAFQGQNLLFEDIEIMNTLNSGVKLHASNCILRRFNIHHGGVVGSNQHHCLYIGADDSNNLFEDIEGHQWDGFGLNHHSSGAGQAALGNEFKRIHIHHVTSPGLWLSHDVKVENVISHDNGSAGIIMNPTSGLTVRVVFASVFNNGIDGNAAGIITRNAGTCELRNYISLGNEDGNYSDQVGGPRLISNGVVAGDHSMYWRNAPNGDFHLNDNATVQINIVGKGEDISGVTTDFDQSTRTTPPDIGAFQLVGDGGGSDPVNVIPPDLIIPMGLSQDFLNFDVFNDGDLVEVDIYADSGRFV